MKLSKIMGLLLAGMMVLALAVPAMAESANELHIFQNKVEIDDAYQAYAALYEEETGVKVTVESVGGGTDTVAILQGYLQAGNMPDIFFCEGPGQFALWKDIAADLSDESWVDLTANEYIVDGVVYGFPIAVEGYGMGYNADLLAKAGIDPATLVNYDAYKAAFEKLDSMKDELGITSVVSFGCSKAGGLQWVGATHNFAVYLSAGLHDTSIIDLALEGKVDTARLTEYANYLKLIMDYSDPDVLLTGTYDQQVAAFADQKAVFIHQGNWIDPTLAAMDLDFDMAYAPHAFSATMDIDGIQVGAPSWLIVNKNGNVEEAKAFLESIAETPEGNDFMVNQAKMVPAFTNVTLQPTTPFSKSVMEYVAAGKTYNWEQYKLPSGFCDNELAPIYELLARGEISVDEFVSMVTDAIALIPNY